MDAVRETRDKLWPDITSTDPTINKRIYNNMADVYDKGSIDAGWNVTFQKIFSVLLDLMPKKEEVVSNEAPVRILDAGCGSGLLVDQHDFTKLHVSLYGIDISDDMVELAKKKNVYEDLRVANLTEKLPFEDDYFDVITSNGVMGYIENTITFSEYLRVLKPDGHILFTMRESHYNERGWVQAVEDPNNNCVVYRKDIFSCYPLNPDFHFPYLFVALRPKELNEE